MRATSLLLILFAFFVSLVFAVIAKDDAREQVRFGGADVRRLRRRRRSCSAG